jgi:NitT/TauT family transport system permease protein
VFGGLTVIGVLAMLMYVLFAVVERRTTGWAHRGQQAG